MLIRRAGNYIESDDDFINLIDKYPVEIIKIKMSLNQTTIGQIIAGNDMFTREYKVAAKRQVILCSVGDSALEWACG
jgi:hypothetical protein